MNVSHPLIGSIEKALLDSPQEPEGQDHVYEQEVLLNVSTYSWFPADVMVTVIPL